MNYQMKRIKTNIIFKFFSLVSLILILACGGAKNTNDDLREFEQLKELVSSREFEIENQWAMPLRGGQINLIGNANFIRFKGDSVEVFLPYFGVRHAGGGYGGEGGIKYEGPAENLSIMEHVAEKNIELTFEGQQGIENLDFLITIYSNGKVNTSVNSSQRDAISYKGDLKALPKEKQ